MSENAIDNENTGKAPDMAKPKSAQTCQEKEAEERSPGQEGSGQAECRPHQQEGRRHRYDEARQGRHPSRDYEGH